MVRIHYIRNIVAVAVLVLILSASSVAYGQQIGRLTVTVDKSSYGAGEAVTISGQVPAILEDVPVMIQIFNPRNVMYTIDQVIPNPDGTYSTIVNIGGKLGISGTYTVKATYARQSVETNFEFVAGPLPGFKVDGFEIKATLSNGSINRIKVDVEFTSLIIDIRTSGEREGTLEITLPREVIDSRVNGADDEFIVLVDGEDTEFEETMTTSNSRTLRIPIRPAATQVEIIGTQVIPEFGILAALILAGAVATIIVVSRRNQILNVLPR